MIPYDAEKLLLFLEEEEFIVNKVKKMLYSQKVAPYVFVIPFVISLLVFWLYPLISGIVMSFQDISFGGDRKSTRLNSSHPSSSRMPSSA